MEDAVVISKEIIEVAPGFKLETVQGWIGDVDKWQEMVKTEKACQRHASLRAGAQKLIDEGCSPVKDFKLFKAFARTQKMNLVEMTPDASEFTVEQGAQFDLFMLHAAKLRVVVKIRGIDAAVKATEEVENE